MSLFKFDWDIDSEYKEMLTSILKFLTVVCVAYTIQGFSSKNLFMNENVFDIVIYLLLGLISYHLVVNKAIRIV